MPMCSIVVAIPAAPDAHLAIAPADPAALHFRRCVWARPAAAIEQHDARKILIVHPASVLVAAPGRLADHLSPPEIAPQIRAARPRAPSTPKRRITRPCNLDRPCSLHDGHTANDGRTRLWLCDCSLGSAQARRLRRSGGLCPRGGGLGDEFIPDARGISPPVTPRVGLLSSLPTHTPRRCRR